MLQRWQRRRRRRVRGLAPGVLLVVLALAGCGDDDGTDVASLGGSAPDQEAGTAGGQEQPSGDRQEAMIEFVECMRTNGVEDMPDPSPNGALQMTDGVASDPDFDAARGACEHLVEGLGSSMDEGARAEMEETVLEFVDCMRKHGVDMPDPDFSGGGVRMGGEGIDQNSPQFQEASAACQHIMQGLRE